MGNFWGAINAIRREATKLRTDLYSAGCFTAQEAAMDLDRAAVVLEAAGTAREAKERYIQFGLSEWGNYMTAIGALTGAALSDEVKE